MTEAAMIWTTMRAHVEVTTRSEARFTARLAKLVTNTRQGLLALLDAIFQARRTCVTFVERRRQTSTCLVQLGDRAFTIGEHVSSSE